MKQNIKNFLEDLYKIDPSFKSKEDDLVKLIEKMLILKPDIKIDKKFVAELRGKVLTNNFDFKKSEYNVKNNYNIMKNFIYGFGGAFVCIAMFLVIYPSVTSISKISSDAESINLNLGGLNISKLSPESFGPINIGETGKGSAVPGVSGSGGGGSVEAKSLDSSDMKIMADPISYKYIYDGEKFEVKDESMAVYRYNGGLNFMNKAASILDKINFGLFDLNKFTNLGMQNLSFVEDRDFGYSVYMDFLNGSVNINENWGRWNQDIYKTDCNIDGPCVDSTVLTLKDLPSDEAINKIAVDFLDYYKINRDNYGEPIVIKEWLSYYFENGNQNTSIPDTIQVIFPLIIDGSKVYEEWGNPVGLTVSVNIRHGKASGLYGLRSESYEQSIYKTEQNIDNILKSLSEGGLRPYYIDANSTFKDVKVGKPELALIRVFSYKDNKNYEMLVPGLIFDITEKPENYYGKPKIVVLLVNNIVDDNNNVITPTPLMMKAE